MTDWDSYYAKPFPLARFTRAYTASRLCALVRRCAPRNKALAVVELGGGDSAFYTPLHVGVWLAKYLAVDRSYIGLSRFIARTETSKDRASLCADVLTFNPVACADVVLSVGLIEHFKSEELAALVKAHFDWATPGSIVIFSFPTPTPVYLSARWIAESLGLWRFHDERPLPLVQVLELVRAHGQVLHHEILWPIVFTQALIVARKHQ